MALFANSTGWLNRVGTKALRWADEPLTSSKFTDAVMLEQIQDSLAELFMDVTILSEGQPVVRYDITYVDGQQDYLLPPTVGNILMFSKRDATTDFLEWEVPPTQKWDPQSLGFYLEGNVLHFLHNNSWMDGDTLELWYVPNGECKPIECTIDDSNGSVTSSTTIELPPSGHANILAGELDMRENAYGGYMLRVLGATDTAGGNKEQLIPITSSSIDTNIQTLTLRRPLSPDLTAETQGQIEVVPVFSRLFSDTLALHVARSLAVTTTSEKKLQLLSQRYIEKARAMRLQLTKWQTRYASRYDGNTYDNLELSTFWRLI